VIRQRPDQRRDRLIWKVIGGEPTLSEEFGVPMATADYVMCLYGGTVPSPLENGQLLVPASVEKWTALRTTGYRYTDPEALESGVQSIVLRAGGHRGTTALVRGRSTQLPNLVLPVPASRLPLLVQLVNSETSTCWETHFAASDIANNSADHLGAKSR
jgi:hypothetical protein